MFCQSLVLRLQATAGDASASSRNHRPCAKVAASVFGLLLSRFDSRNALVSAAIVSMKTQYCLQNTTNCCGWVDSCRTLASRSNSAVALTGPTLIKGEMANKASEYLSSRVITIALAFYWTLLQSKKSGSNKRHQRWRKILC